MAFDTIYLIYGAIFLAALLLVEGLYHLFYDGKAGRDAVNRRMKMLESGATTREVFQTLRRDSQAEVSYLGPLKNWGSDLDNLIQQTGMLLTIQRLLLMMVALAIGCFLTIMVLARGGVFAGSVTAISIIAVTSIAVGIGGPIAFLKYKKAERLKAFAEQLPDALDVMVRSLQAGHPVSAAMTLVTKEMPDPIGTEFGIAVDEMTYGLELREALANLGERVDVEDYQYVVVSINIQHETGGNLAEVLHGLSTVIRARFRMFKKIRALSAEGRLSAKILAILPIAFAALTFSNKPQYYINASSDPLFWPLVGVTICLELIGIYVMYRLVNFRV
ncbi:MAG: type II secretion system F family protein [Alphaproteobacteria bacterium]|nr:type II secretion system F family protein [Alphaproteobacteria bacterium]